MYSERESLRCVIIRVGINKGIFIMKNELPKEPKNRGTIIRAIFGNPYDFANSNYLDNQNDI